MPDDAAARRAAGRGRSADVGLVIAAGGALGALARHGVSLALPATGFPWATLVVNLSGSLAIGVLMVLLTEVAGRPHRLARPFVGVGLLGGYTTFSTYAVDAHLLAGSGALVTAALYVLGTVLGALLAVEAGMALTRLLTRAKGTSR